MNANNFYQLNILIYFFHDNWIGLDFFELICLIILVNNYFHVSSKNKVDLVIADVPSKLLISHVSKPLSFIIPWNKRMDNFIESIVFFINMFMFDRRAIIIMHVDDLRMLKEIRSLLRTIN